MAGVVNRVVGTEDFRRFRQAFLSRVVQRHAHKVEAANQHVRTEPAGNVQDALVGTAAEEDPAPVFFDEQVLFMTEIFRIQHAVAFHQHAAGIDGADRFPVIAVVQGDAFRQPGFPFDKTDLSRARQRRVQSDILRPAVF